MDPAAAALVAVPVLQHLGAVHGFERLLVAVIAIAPFLVLGVAMYVARRRSQP